MLTDEGRRARDSGCVRLAVSCPGNAIGVLPHELAGVEEQGVSEEGDQVSYQNLITVSGAAEHCSVPGRFHRLEHVVRPIVSYHVRVGSLDHRQVAEGIQLAVKPQPLYLEGRKRVDRMLRKLRLGALPYFLYNTPTAIRAYPEL